MALTVHSLWLCSARPSEFSSELLDFPLQLFDSEITESLAQGMFRLLELGDHALTVVVHPPPLRHLGGNAAHAIGGPAGIEERNFDRQVQMISIAVRDVLLAFDRQFGFQRAFMVGDQFTGAGPEDFPHCLSGQFAASNV